MMGKHNFDKHIDRRGTGALKWDSLGEWFGADDLTALWVADMDFEVCPEIMAALRNRLSHPILGYAATPAGYWDSITSWLERRHRFKVSRDELTFTPGVVKGLALAVNFFSRPGDRIIIQPPVYHPFKMVIEGNGRVVTPNPLIDRGDHYEMDLEGLAEIARRDKPSMMVLCNPHNPIGIQWDADTLKEVARIARANGITVVSDEIHGDLMLKGGRHLPMASVSDDAAAVTVTLGAPSKTFNIPGMVSSWIMVKNRELREPFFNWLSANEFNEAPMTATIAAEAAYNHGEQWLDELLDYLDGTIDAVIDFCNRRLPMIKVYRPQASFLVWLDCRSLGLEQKELVDLFIKEARLALNDGSMFGDEGRGFMRLNVAAPRAEITAALEKLENALARRSSQCDAATNRQ